MLKSTGCWHSGPSHGDTQAPPTFILKSNCDRLGGWPGGCPRRSSRPLTGDPATVLEVQGSLKPGPHTVSQALLQMGINTEAGEAVSQKHDSAILETVSKVPGFVLFHHAVALRSPGSQPWAAGSLAHQHHLGVSSLAYQGKSWPGLYLSCAWPA